MGRTLKTANQIVLDEQQEFANFYRALRREDQLVFSELFTYARKHIAAISMASHALPFEAALLAMLLEVSKKCSQAYQQVEELKQMVAEQQRLVKTLSLPGNE